MPPKPKTRSKTTTTKKEKKVPLTRGRTKKAPISTSHSDSEGEEAYQPDHDHMDDDQQSEASSAVSASASERDHDHDHRGGQGNESEDEVFPPPGVTSTSTATPSSPKKKTKVKATTKSKPVAKAKAKPIPSDTEEDEDEMEDKPVPEVVGGAPPPQEEVLEVEEFKHLEHVPDLVEELRGKRETSITYVTKDVRHRQFELKARKALLQSYNDLGTIKDALDQSLHFTHRLCPDSKHGNVAEAIKTLNFPTNFADLVLKLMHFPKPPQPSSYSSRMHETLFEESEDDLNIENDDVAPVGPKTPKRTFPSPSKIAKFSTPVQNQHQEGVFQFRGDILRSGILSTNKAPRPPKPGEIFFSEGGSPILNRRIPDDMLSKPMERIALTQPDGSKLEIDMVYRGTQDTNRLQGFKEFAKDVRTIAASRSTVKAKRLHPPRIAAKGVTQSASKVKPIWH